MLRANVKFQLDKPSNISLGVKAAPHGLAATLCTLTASDYKHLAGYQLWSESGFAMLSRAFAEFAPVLSQEVGPFALLELRITSTSELASDKSPLCVATLTCGDEVHRLNVTGPVLRATLPVRGADVPQNLHDLLQFTLALCDSMIGNEGPLSTTVPIYSGGNAERFVFIDELPLAVMPWFVAHAKLTNPTALQRHGQTASARAYADFCCGRG
jgi:hypothetical protein